MNNPFAMDQEIIQPSQEEERSGVKLLTSWLNKNMKVEMSDGRVLIGIFLCTDRYIVKLTKRH